MPIQVKVTIKGSSMTIDLSGCSQRAQGRHQFADARRRRVAYKALTGPLDPVNEGSFRALDVDHSRRQHHDGALSGADGGLERDRADRRRLHRRGARQAMPDRVPAGHHGLLGGAVVFFGIHPKTGRRFVVQSIEGGGWGGRPSEDGESGTVSVCQGDVRNGSIEGIELKCPVMVESRALRRIRAAPANTAAARHRYAGSQSVEGLWNFEQTRRAQRPPWGLWGGTSGETEAYLLRLPA